MTTFMPPTQLKTDKKYTIHYISRTRTLITARESWMVRCSPLLWSFAKAIKYDTENSNNMFIFYSAFIQCVWSIWMKKSLIVTDNELQICNDEILWQCSWLEIRLNVFLQSTILQKQFINKYGLQSYHKSSV